MMSLFSQQQLNIKEVCFASLRLYREIFTHVWFLALITGFLINVSIFFGAFYPLKFQLLAGVIRGTTACVIISVVVRLISVYLFAVTLHRTYVIGNVQNVSLTDSFCCVNRKYLQIVVCAVIARVFVLLGLFLLFVPGVYIAIVFFMLEPFILFDNKSIFSALKSSFLLVNGNWWRTFTVFFLPMFALSFSYVTVYFVEHFSLMPNIWYVFVGNTLAITLLFPLASACILTQFNDLKLRRKA